MTSILEVRYRRALRWYPSTWRELNEDAVIGTLLDVAEGENRSLPRLGEQVDLVVNGLLTRIGVFLPTGVRNGVASVALATGTAFATVYFFFLDWAPWTAANRAVIMPAHHDFGPFVNAGVIVCALWAAGLVFAAFGRYKVTRIIMVLINLAAVAIPFLNQLPFAGWAIPSSTNLGFFGLLAAFSLIGKPPSRVRLAAGTGIALALLVAVYAQYGVFHHFYMGDRFFWATIANSTTLGPLLVATFLVAIGFGLARRGEIAAVMALSTLPWAAAWLVGVAVNDRGGVATVCGAALLLAGIVTASIAALKRSGFEIIVRRRDGSR